MIARIQVGIVEQTGGTLKTRGDSIGANVENVAAIVLGLRIRVIAVVHESAIE